MSILNFSYLHSLQLVLNELYNSPYIYEFLHKLEFNNINVIIATIMVIICPVTWNLVARLEYYTKFFTRKCKGNNRLAADIFAHVLIEMGFFRNYMMKRALDNTYNMEFSKPVSTIMEFASIVSFIVGFLFVFGAYWRLGIHGIYYGDYFGILMKEKCSKFPYNISENPLYQGSQMLFASSVLWYKSPTGVYLLILLALMYQIAELLENPMTNIIYGSKVEEGKKNKNQAKISQSKSQQQKGENQNELYSIGKSSKETGEKKRKLEEENRNDDGFKVVNSKKKKMKTN